MLTRIWLLPALAVIAFQQLKTVEIPLAQPIDSVAWLSFEGILTWREGKSVFFCVLRGATCQGKYLTDGKESYAFACNECHSVLLAVATPAGISVYQVNIDGDVEQSVTISTERPQDITGIFLDESRALIFWSGLSNSLDYEIFGCLLSNGIKLECGFVVNSFAQGDQRHPTVTKTQDGAIVVWESAGFRVGLFGQRLTATGKKTHSEFLVVDGVQYRNPMLIPGPVLMLNRKNGADPRVATCVFPVFEATAAKDMWVLNEFEARGITVSGAVLGSELYLLHNFVDFQGCGRVEIRKVIVSGCVQSQYRTSNEPLHSHSRGVILEVTAERLSFLYYDEVRKVHILQTLSNPENSVCSFPTEPRFPPWIKPTPARDDSWRKILFVSLFCLSFVIFVIAIVCLVRYIVRRRNAKREAENRMAEDQSAIIGKGDNSMSLFEIAPPSSPTSFDKLGHESLPSSPVVAQD